MDIIKAKIFDYHIQSKTLFIIYGYEKRKGKYVDIFTCFIDDKDDLKKYLLGNVDIDDFRRDIYFGFLPNLHTPMQNRLSYFFQGNADLDILQDNRFIKTEYLDKLGRDIYLCDMEKGSKILFILYGYYTLEPSKYVKNIFLVKLFDNISEYHKYLRMELKRYRDTRVTNSISIWHHKYYREYNSDHMMNPKSYRIHLKNLNINDLEDITAKRNGEYICTYFRHKIIPIEDIKIV